MRSKMLGLAIALSTFGLGVATTAAWIAYHMPHAYVDGFYLPRGEVVRTRTEIVAVPGMVVRPNVTAPCAASRESDGNTFAAFNAGALQAKAISMPQPRYPAEARAAQVSGQVVLFVVVNECGNVTTASVASGHPLLQRAALDAVKGWRYSPTLLNGKPVKVSGTVTFDFVL